jgi:hypothetical protein
MKPIVAAAEPVALETFSWKSRKEKFRDILWFISLEGMMK